MSKTPSRKAPPAPRDGGGGGPPAGHPGDANLLAECRVDTFRSGGSGGQHQNKVESGVRLTHRPTGLVATSRRHRSQHRNREEALRLLSRKLESLNRPKKTRVPTPVPRREKRKRLEDKRRRSRVKRLRGAPDRDD